MNIDDVIEDYIDTLLGVYRNYLSKPSWEKIQSMLRTTLYLGIELGKKQARIDSGRCK